MQNSNIKVEVYFSCTSQSLSFDELQKLTTLKGEGWNRGDIRKTGKSKHSFSRLSIKPYSVGHDFELLLEKLVIHLEKDTTGILRLSQQSDGAYISVHSKAYNEDSLNPHLSSDILKRIAALNLSIDIDEYTF